MKKLTKKQWIIVALAAALVAAAGVGIWMMSGNDDGGKNTKKTSGEPPKTTEELMERAAENFSAVDSYQLDTEMTLAVESEGESVEMTSMVTNFFKRDSDVQKMITSMTMGDYGGYSTTTYIEKDGDSYHVYNSEDGGIQWKHETVGVSELPTTGDPSAEVLRFLNDVTDYKKGDTKEIGGVMTTCYECVLEAEDMQTALKETGLLEQLGGDDLSEEDLNTLYEEMDGIQYSVWIGNEDYLPYRLYMDMGNLVQILSSFADIDDQQKDMMESLEGITMTYNISNYDLLEEIEVPKEAKNAKETE